MNHEFPLEPAIVIATIAADKHGIAQTVFRTKDTNGWANTSALASFLHKAEVFVTILPARYFS